MHAERLARSEQAVHGRAAALLAEFAEVARERLPAVPLRVLGYGGRGSARTSLSGWYLRTDRTSGVSTTGDFYILTAPLTLVERLRGTEPTPAPPPMVLGAGGKDGESIDLPAALERLLPGWRTPRD